MARTLNEIESALDASISTAIDTPSASQFAEWRLWKSIFARALWVFEGIMDLFKTEIETRVQTKQFGSYDWYYDRILEFQGANDDSGVFQGDTLVVTETGVLKYETIDPTRRIIKQASLRSVEGILIIKLAKALDAESYQPLNSGEQAAFGLYLENIKYPGTDVSVISMAADLIKYDLEIIYDPIYTVATVEANVLAKLAEYGSSLGFDDRIYPAKMVEKAMEAAGVVAVKRNSVAGYHATIDEWTTIDIVYTLVSGYFNFDEACALTFTNFKTLS